MRWIRAGLAGPVEDTDDQSLVAAPLDEVTEDVTALIEWLTPSLVVSYDENGGYGHPDHVRIREAALAASGAQAIPFAEILPAATPTAPPDGDEDAPAGPGSTDAEYFRLDAHLETLKAALASHATQLTVDGAEIIHSGGQRQPIETAVGLRLV